MDIVVHGTKGGRQIFTPKKIGGLLDVNSDASKASAIGQEAFAIRFVENAIIFSKYKIIRDVRGDKRTGFLAFSLFLPNNKKLYGNDIISVLNKVLVEYCRSYIPDNDNNLKDVREDWAFLDRLSEEYKTKLRHVSIEDIENLLSGTKDDAFIYYENDEKLQKYFDSPFQDEYRQYRQVLFVKEEFKEKSENPLNALRHSEDNLSGKIDLENLKYKLLFNQRTNEGVRIDVKVNRVTLPSFSKIRRKDELEISWSKQFCETVTKSGKWNEISNEFIDVNSISGTVTVKEIVPPDDIKTINFNIKDWNGNSVYEANLVYKYAGIEKTVENYNRFTFKGEELGIRWTVSAFNDRFYSAERLIEFAKDCPGDTGNIDIVLDKHSLKKQKVTVLDESNGDNINNFNLSKTEFTGSEIKETHRITVSCFEYESKSFTYCPASAIYLEPIKLKKKEYSSGAKTINSDIGSPDNNGTSEGDKIFSQNKKNKPFYKRPKFIAGTIVGSIIICISIGIWIMYGEKKEVQFEQPQQNDYQYIQAYIKGDSLILNTLNSYKEAVGDGPTEILIGLDSAINKRKAINSWNFLEIKKPYYYPSQNKFISVICKIDSSKYNIVKNKLGDVSSWSLDQIADSINAVLNDTKTVTEKKSEVKKEVTDERKEESQAKATQLAKTEQKREEKALPTPVKIDKTTEIIQYLKGDELKKEQLNKYLNDVGSNAALKKSIQRCLNFWDLDGSKNKSYSSFLKEIGSDANLNKSKLKSFVDEFSQKDKPQYPREVAGAATNTLQQLYTKIRK